MKQKKFFIFVVSALLLIITGGYRLSIVGAAQMDAKMEYKIKAAFLLNFAKFITWPEEEPAGANQPFVMCILGRDPFGSSLAGIESRTVGKRKIRLRAIDSPAQVNGCRLLFVSESEKQRISRILAALQGHAVVTVSDIPGFAASGGIIEFVTRNNRLSFKINLARANRQGLHINASLLNLATEVIQ